VMEELFNGYGARMNFRWREMKAEMGLRERQRYDRFFSIKKFDWEATVLPNTLGSTVATQPKCVKLG